tara:strand:+ start:440 stop:733 length:294 start_codon:yes stop_codon:yes gene_type:complete
MVTTGRDVDRFLLAIVMFAILMLGVYTFTTSNKLANKVKIDESGLNERMNYLTDQLSQTRQQITDWTASKPVEESPSENPPSEVVQEPVGVSSGFLS